MLSADIVKLSHGENESPVHDFAVAKDTHDALR